MEEIQYTDELLKNIRNDLLTQTSHIDFSYAP